MEKKGHLSDSECGTVAGVRQTDLSISETVDLMGFHRKPHQGFTENYREEHPIMHSVSNQMGYNT